MFWIKPYSKILIGSKNSIFKNKNKKSFWNILALNPENKPKKRQINGQKHLKI
jgi:hypothetical protein